MSVISKGAQNPVRFVRPTFKFPNARSAFRAYIQSLGLGPAEVWVSHSDKGLISALAYVAHYLKVPVGTVNVENVGSADSVQFSERKIASITIHSLTQEKFNEHILHTANDKIAAIQLDDYYQTYRLLAAYLVYLDLAVDIDPTKSH